ncbi:uncharacterized protein B0I36DRAFT_329377 [Microdochium trichocladiopsis]|uniref:Uncharacterized protein n=1 Tax=Microdochium trichocladiopsis TaxID=1682393 RepID=A0A9P8XZB9_9PEZI|nr:uncharacterized protein B0I36DRAFT_329377 [Microdochium trichocladiopsis]KAH7025893.1 hypothetical protein B0I36DRAFT_329377 [Microdochium trichocladiopsis]
MLGAPAVVTPAGHREILLTRYGAARRTRTVQSLGKSWQGWILLLLLGCVQRAAHGTTM